MRKVCLGACLRLFLPGIACLLLLPGFVSAASSPEFTRFESLTIEDGLRQNTAGSLLQDSQGFIWIGTEAGLHRYDGQEFRLFRHEPGNPDSLADNFSLTLAEDPDGWIWIGTMSGGIHRLNSRTGKVERVAISAADADTHGLIWGIHAEASGRVWAVSHDGVLLKEADETSFRVLSAAATDDEDKAVSAPYIALEKDAHGRMVFATTRGLARLNDDGELVAWRERSDGTTIPSDHVVSALFRDSQGNLWAGGGGGVYQLPMDGGLIKYGKDHPLGEIASNAAIWTIDEGVDGHLWIATYGRGLLRFNRERDIVRRFSADPAMPRSLAEDNLMALLVDSSGLVWVGTESSGLQRLNPQALSFGQFGHHPFNEESLPNPVVWAIEARDDGTMWVGTQQGLARLGWPAEAELESAMRMQVDGSDSEPHITSLHDDGQQRLWIGSMQGLWQSDASPDGDGQYTRVPLFELLDEEPPAYWPPIYSVVGDQSGRLYLTLEDSVVGGSVDADKDNTDWGRLIDSTRTGLGELHGLWQGADERLWMVGARGVARYDINDDRIDLRIGNAEWQGEGPLLELSHGGISGLAEDDDSTVWLATQTGVYRVDLESQGVRHFTDKDGLPADVAYTIGLDSSGNVWASTSLGLAVISGDDEHIQTFDVSDGLQSNEFNAGAFKRLPDGRMVFGGLNGINVFDPSRLERHSPPPPVAITSVTLGEQDYRDFDWVLSGEALEVPYQERYVAFTYTALDFRNPARNRFEYKLQGFDEAWRSADRLNRAVFTNLPPGDYVFRVRAANSLGVWNEKGVSMPFRVQTPPWLHPIAFVLYALTLLLLLFLAFRLYVRRQTRERLIEEERDRRVLAENLQRVSARLAATLDSDRVMDQLASILEDMLAIDTAVLFLEDDGRLQLLGSRGNESARRSLERAPGLLPDAVERTRSSAVVQLLEHGELMLLSHPDPKQVSGALVPLVSSDEGIGLLGITRKGAAFSPLERDLLSSIGTQAMMALQKARLFARVQELATTDGLTGLLNRRHFEHSAIQELERACRYSHETTLLLLDIDYFKRINDRHGHEVGDDCLKRFSRLLVDELRRSDLVARFGGEEFIALLPETGLDRGMEVAERIRHALESLKIPPKLAAGDLTISIGLSLAEDEAKDLETLVREADMALYEAKRQGRNRVVASKGLTGGGDAPG